MTLSAMSVVSLSIRPGGAVTETEKVLCLSAKKGTWWLTPPHGMHHRLLLQIHQMTGGFTQVLSFIFVLIGLCSLHFRDAAAGQS